MNLNILALVQKNQKKRRKTMTKSKLIVDEVPAHPNNYTKGRIKKIRCITVHHMAGKLDARNCGIIFQNPNRQGSSHYGIGFEGEIMNYVDENDTAWTNSNWPSNCESITIECSNSQNGGEWPISIATFESLVNLVRDIRDRYNLGNLVVGENLTYHSMFADTNCPGPYLKHKLGELCDRVNGSKISTPKSKSIDEIAQDVIMGRYGNAPERYKRLTSEGYDSVTVQKRVNELIKKQQETQSSPTENIEEGDKVQLKSLKDIDGTPLRLTRTFYYVIQKSGMRAVLATDMKNGQIYCAAHINNLKKIS